MPAPTTPANRPTPACAVFDRLQATADYAATVRRWQNRPSTTTRDLYGRRVKREEVRP